MAFSSEKIESLWRREADAYAARTPKSAALAKEAAAHWLKGVPLHWMSDWELPHALFLKEAKGAQLKDADGNLYADFCLGDTGAMFGHGPGPAVKAVADQMARGATAMLPSELAPETGRLLSDYFGLDQWQVTASASDANRAIIRWARGVTGRKRILIFDGSYHGAVDDVFVRIGEDGKSELRPGLVGQVADITATTAVVPFNDRDAVRAEFAKGDIALVLTEPLLTNIGMVPSDPGFIEFLAEAAREAGAFFALDETHTLSSGLGGWGRVHGLRPDFLVVGKPIGGGVPAAVYGFTSEVAARLAAFNETRAPGHSGIGTTLSGSALQLAAIRAMLSEVMTEAAYAYMERLAGRLEAGLTRIFKERGVSWHVLRVGARAEIGFTGAPVRTGAESAQRMNHPLERALHLYLLNRGLMLTPFHNMMLISPETREEDIDRLTGAVSAFLTELFE
ncbi:transaminase [Tepidicaulis sp. LMO-SS28]|uniref:transaminase n=1 Tax=Tepidicaulis sp. LMO-SS28 TaxID=3447455 RepID=UPI003EDF44FB